jgi:hypothetical protein
VEVVGEQRGAAGHDRRLGEAEEHAAGHDQLQGRQPQRRGAHERVDDERPDEQALAADPVDDAPGDHRGQPDHQGGCGQHDRGQGLDAGGAREGVLDAREHRCEQHRPQHRQAAGQQEDEGLRPAGRTARRGIEGHLPG